MTRKLCLTIILISILFLSKTGYSQNVPAPEGWVNDFAGVISASYEEKITEIAQELESKTSSEITVVTINSIAPYDEKQYARLLFDKWKPGKKGKDNGVLVLLVVKDRLWRIEIGYGLEGILPDGLCGDIGRTYMIPYFKEGRYGEGLYYGVAVISRTIAQATQKTLTTLDGIKNLDIITQEGFDDLRPWLGISVIAIFLFMVIRYIYWLPTDRNYYRLGGGGYYGGYGGGGGFGGGGSGGGFGGFGGGLGGGGGAGGKF